MLLSFLSKSKSPQGVAGVVLRENRITVAVISQKSQSVPELHLLSSFDISDERQGLKELFAFVQAHRLSQMEWHIILEPGQYQLLQVDVPDIPDDEINDTLKLKAADLIQFPLSEAAVAVVRLPEEAYRGRMKMAYLAVARSQMLQTWKDQFGLAGMKLGSIDVTDMAMRNIGLLASQKSRYAVLQMDQRQSNIYCCSNANLCLQRRIEIGIASFEDADDTNNEFIQIQLDATSLEIQRSLDYFESQMGMGTIDDIILLTFLDFPQQFIDRLDEMLHPVIHRWMPEDQLLNSSFQSMPVSPEEFRAIGGALRYLERHS